MTAAVAKRVSYDQGCLKSVRKLPDYVSGKFLDLMARYMDNPASNGLNLESVKGVKTDLLNHYGWIKIIARLLLKRRVTLCLFM